MSFVLTPHRKNNGAVALFTLQTEGELSDADWEQIRALHDVYTSPSSVDRARRRMAKVKGRNALAPRSVAGRKIERPAVNPKEIQRQADK